MTKKIKITKNGPYLISGKIPLAKEIIEYDKDGYPIEWKKGDKYPPQESYLLCRCGNSRTLPYCDRSHLKTGFNGQETARRKKYLDQAEKITGPKLDLTDAQEFCFGAGFCDRAGGIWNLTEESDDPKARETAIDEGCQCPSGRLVTWKKSGEAIEPNFKPGLSLIEEPQKNASGPIWVKGGIPLESEDGSKYETRNRMTLCRCGRSGNKPFCDGTHISIGFNDGDKAVN